MKKALLFVVLAITVQVSFAQLYLNGSSYTQNFNSLATLPTGWHIYTGASATSLGNDMVSTKYFPGKTNTWTKTFGEFREVASANASTFFGSLDSAAQGNATDRALAVRQVGPTSTSFPGSDSGAAFALQIANPDGLTNWQLTFKLQSLDSTSPRITTWSVQYGLGAMPTSFTSVAISGDSTTGGNTYSNATNTVNFGTALDGKTAPVWIRIVTLKPTTGGGNRTTTGIDDFNLTWTGNANGIKDANIASMPLTAYATSNTATVSFASPKAGEYNVLVMDLSGRTIRTEKFTAGTGDQEYTMNNLSLQAGMYIVRLTGENALAATKVVVQ